MLVIQIFSKKNSGVGKQFPGGPTCRFRGKDVPCFCRWSKKGGITAEILKDILQTFDEYDLFPWVNGLCPFLLLDGHGSRFELPFLLYINDPAHEWVVTIGVPYGTALWQVGDLLEQNGSFNIASTKEKRKIIEKKDKIMILPYIQPYEIINIVSAAWKKSFAWAESNQKAISECGWLPFNRNILTYPIVCATMTKEEKDEKLEMSNVLLPFHKLDEVIDCVTLPTFNPDLAKKDYDETKKILNFGNGSAAWCLDTIVMNQDLMAARSHI